MGKESKIEWTDHTFNPWWGCVDGRFWDELPVRAQA